MLENRKRIMGAILLVAGTMIGGGMLGLPVLIAGAGFLPSLLISFICWAFMASTGLLFLEVTKWCEKETNIVSMAEKTMGSFGKVFAWLVYLFLFNCLMIAYTVGIGKLFAQILANSVSPAAGSTLFVILFSPLIIMSTVLATKLNSLLVAGLAISYFLIISLGISHLDYAFLAATDWSQTFKILPIAFISFGYQGIVPTLTSYLNHRSKDIKIAILVGSFIPFIAYNLWNAVMLGVIPYEGDFGLKQAHLEGDNVIASLRHFVKTPLLYYAGQAFAFFALITSFLGVSLGLRDFLADGLRIKKNFRGKIILFILVCAFPLIVAVANPSIFLVALEYAGGFGSALLLGLLPILMAWRGRYSLKLGGYQQLKGGKIVLLLLAFFACFEIIQETIRQFYS